MSDTWQPESAAERWERRAMYVADEVELLRNANEWLREELTRTQRDTDRITWLQAILIPGEPAAEIFLAGLRGRGDAKAFQVEIAPAAHEWKSYRGDTLRQAIDAAMSPPAASLPLSEIPPHE